MENERQSLQLCESLIEGCKSAKRCWTRGVCAYAEQLTGIFNTSLSPAAVLPSLKAVTIILLPNKTAIKVLIDYNRTDIRLYEVLGKALFSRISKPTSA